MAVFLKATCSKKLGLLQYSSYQYAVEVSAELTDVSRLAQASQDLYSKFQQTVDSQIINPGHTPGEKTPSRPVAQIDTPAKDTAPSNPLPNGEAWRCSDRQRDLILKIVDEHRATT